MKSSFNPLILLLLIQVFQSCNDVKIRANSIIGSEAGNETVPAGFPADAVVAFDSAACPVGWSAFNDANGRIIVGAGNGNLDSLGDPLTNRTRGDSGGLEYTTGIPAVNGVPDGVSFTGILAGGDYYSAAIPDLSLSDVAADSNFPPYTVRTYCKKLSDSATDITNSSVATESATCNGTWIQDANLKGRIVIGTGNGNNDSLGVALTVRALNAQGGNEFTPNMPACSGASDGTTVPDPTKCLSTNATGESMFRAGVGTLAFAGAKADSNMPPFQVLLVCTNSAANDLLDSGSVVAFDRASCPVGWSVYSDLAGRTIVAANDIATATLSVRTSGTNGGLEYTTGLPFNPAIANLNAPVGGGSVARGQIGFLPYKVAAADTTITGVKANSNMSPFYVLLYCKKD